MASLSIGTVMAIVATLALIYTVEGIMFGDTIMENLNDSFPTSGYDTQAPSGWTAIFDQLGQFLTNIFKGIAFFVSLLVFNVPTTYLPAIFAWPMRAIVLSGILTTIAIIARG